MRPTPTQLADTVEQVMELSSHTIGKKNVALKNEVKNLPWMGTYKHKNKSLFHFFYPILLFMLCVSL